VQESFHEEFAGYTDEWLADVVLRRTGSLPNENDGSSSFLVPYETLSMNDPLSTTMKRAADAVIPGLV